MPGDGSQASRVLMLHASEIRGKHSFPRVAILFEYLVLDSTPTISTTCLRRT